MLDDLRRSLCLQILRHMKEVPAHMPEEARRKTQAHNLDISTGVRDQLRVSRADNSITELVDGGEENQHKRIPDNMD